MTETFHELEAEKTVEGRVFLLDGEAWLRTDKDFYRIEDAEFVADCREHVEEIRTLAASLHVRRERSTDHSTGGANYLPHRVGSVSASVQMMTLDTPRKTIWAKTPVLCALADQGIEQELAT